MIDLHCHILPGVDDGPRDLEEALAMARVAAADGITAAAATPHVFRGVFPPVDLGAFAALRGELAAAISAAGIELSLFAGAEAHVSHDLAAALRNHREALTLGAGSCFFLEFPAEHVLPDVKAFIFSLTSEGFTPIVAHPERNAVFARRPELLCELEEMGVLAQINGGSLLGLYGAAVREAAVRFLGWNLVQVIASDGHDAGTRAPRLSEAVREAARIVGDSAAAAMVLDNPRAILEDREPPYHPEPALPAAGRGGPRLRLPRWLRSRAKDGAERPA